MTLYRRPELISLLYNGRFARRLHGVISHHTRCLLSGLGLLASTKAQMQAAKNLARGGGAGGVAATALGRAAGRAEAEPCRVPHSPGVPLPHPDGMRGHGACKPSHGSFCNRLGKLATEMNLSKLEPQGRKER